MVIDLCWADELVFPKEGESNYHTLIWQLDPRTKLYTDTSASAKAHSTKTDTYSFPVEGTGSRATLDVTIMASKLVYENPEVVKKVVEQDWNVRPLTLQPSTANLRSSVGESTLVRCIKWHPFPCDPTTGCLLCMWNCEPLSGHQGYFTYRTLGFLCFADAFCGLLHLLEWWEILSKEWLWFYNLCSGISALENASSSMMDL